MPGEASVLYMRTQVLYCTMILLLSYLDFARMYEFNEALASNVDVGSSWT